MAELLDLDIALRPNETLEEAMQEMIGDADVTWEGKGFAGGASESVDLRGSVEGLHKFIDAYNGTEDQEEIAFLRSRITK